MGQVCCLLKKVSEVLGSIFMNTVCVDGKQALKIAFEYLYTLCVDGCRFWVCIWCYCLLKIVSISFVKTLCADDEHALGLYLVLVRCLLKIRDMIKGERVECREYWFWDTGLNRWLILVFHIVLNFKELVISLQPDVRLRWGLDLNVAFEMDLNWKIKIEYCQHVTHSFDRVTYILLQIAFNLQMHYV